MNNAAEALREHQYELWATVVVLLVFLLLRFIVLKTIRRIGSRSLINVARTKLISRYLSFGLAMLLGIALVFIWGVNIRDIALVVSSIFAVLGVALFATWSILSNLTSGIILFFYFPYKIGDRIRIQDKDFPDEALILDIQAFNINLLKDNGELLTYPNNLLLQKGVVLVEKQTETLSAAEQDA
ncbi:Small-conductance mechanosensitive channel [Croceitalea dokdonensis DOKDO 023]|uniref:Small-conductance mechanosensitive channel n=1 Tax=Croceitalea dokdonensis DOKDO 023 TaxID=1300341 RepID=A0A0P7AA47_9FLAO|nr:mechanosensitive ion channel domain-containing protein [Croceitalea dokdonensis]KPM33765.1 Small-conductance mechanosensitive channel [Croceitalea dokdonensis DOKDO 023]